jgi:hypothetical protein
MRPSHHPGFRRMRYGDAVVRTIYDTIFGRKGASKHEIAH